MVKIKIWGPITWNLLHTIAEKIYDDRFIHAGSGTGESPL